MNRRTFMSRAAATAAGIAATTSIAVEHQARAQSLRDIETVRADQLLGADVEKVFLDGRELKMVTAFNVSEGWVVQIDIEADPVRWDRLPGKVTYELASQQPELPIALAPAAVRELPEFDQADFNEGIASGIKDSDNNDDESYQIAKSSKLRDRTAWESGLIFGYELNEQLCNYKHAGLHAHRLDYSDGGSTSRERAFAAAWASENSSKHGQSSRYLRNLLLVGDAGSPLDPFGDRRKWAFESGYTQEHATLAATLMQWLGTNVGHSFLCTALQSCGYVVLSQSDLSYRDARARDDERKKIDEERLMAGAEKQVNISRSI